MRRIIALAMALLLILGMTACSQTNTKEPGPALANGVDTTANGGVGTSAEQGEAVILDAKVMGIDENSILAASMDKAANETDIYRINTGNTEILDKDGKRTDIRALKNGMLIDIFYDGTIMESFPMQLGNIKSIRITEEGDDLAGLYLKVIKDLYDVDPGLNDSIVRLAFNLNDVTNLAETEKTALVYMAGNEFALETLQGTFEELREQGYIDKDQLYFETGLLYTIKVKSEKSNSFVFDAEKWRSGLGAYFYMDCTAKREKNGWTYTIGGQAIS